MLSTFERNSAKKRQLSIYDFTSRQGTVSEDCGFIAAKIRDGFKRQPFVLEYIQNLNGTKCPTVLESYNVVPIPLYRYPTAEYDSDMDNIKRIVDGLFPQFYNNMVELGATTTEIDLNYLVVMATLTLPNAKAKHGNARSVRTAYKCFRDPHYNYLLSTIKSKYVYPKEPCYSTTCFKLEPTIGSHLKPVSFLFGKHVERTGNSKVEILKEDNVLEFGKLIRIYLDPIRYSPNTDGNRPVHMCFKDRYGTHADDAVENLLRMLFIPETSSVLLSSLCTKIVTPRVIKALANDISKTRCNFAESLAKPAYEDIKKLCEDTGIKISTRLKFGKGLVGYSPQRCPDLHRFLDTMPIINSTGRDTVCFVFNPDSSNKSVFFLVENTKSHVVLNNKEVKSIFATLPKLAHERRMDDNEHGVYVKPVNTTVTASVLPRAFSSEEVNLINGFLELTLGIDETYNHKLLRLTRDAASWIKNQ